MVLKAGDATVDQYEKLLVEVAKQSGSLAGGVSDSVTALTKGGSAIVLTGATKDVAKLAANGSDKDLTAVELDSVVTAIDLNKQAAILDANDLNNATITINGGSYSVKDTSTNVAGLDAAKYATKAVTLTDETSAADIKTITDGNAASISYTKLTDTASKISGTLANIKAGVTVKVNDKAKGSELKSIYDKATGVSATLDLAKVEDSLVELEKVKTLLKDRTVTLTGTASAAKYKSLLDENPTSLAGAVSDTVTALTDGISLTLTGATSVTAVLDAGGGDKDLTGVKLDSRVSVIDLNGQAATLDADDLGNATVTLNGGSYGVKDTSTKVAALTASLYANKAVTITDTTNAADIKTLTDGIAASIAYTKLSDTADNINGTLANIKAGVEVDISDNADTTEFKAISDKVGNVGGGATLTASTVRGTIDELVAVKEEDIMKD